MDNMRAYIDLKKEEKLKIYDFMKKANNFSESFEKMEESFTSKIYNYGNGVIFYFEQEEVIANVCIVLEVAQTLHTAYIYKINIVKDKINSSDILTKLLHRGITIAKEYGALDIRIGYIGDYIIKELEKINIVSQYKAVEMNLEDRSKRFEILDIKELNEENKHRYVKIYSDSFCDIPHGSVTDIDTVNKLLQNKNNNSESEYYYIVCDNDKEIGFMEIRIEDNKGIFDIGLCKKYRGKGYGKRLLETAIQFLVEKKVEEIRLIVIEENKVAYNMYKDRGFKIKNIITEWSKA